MLPRSPGVQRMRRRTAKRGPPPVCVRNLDSESPRRRHRARNARNASHTSARYSDRILSPVMRTSRLLSGLVLAMVCAAAWTHVRAQSTASLDPALLGTMRWRSISPANTGGRVADLAVARVPGLPDAVYVATASGGIF